MKFSGTNDYISTKDLTIAVNAAITLERPLLVKGEPGTGKTELAKQVASSLGLEIFEWSIKSTTRAQQGLYEYDAVSRLRDSQIGDQNVSDISKYIKKGKIWNSFESKNKSVLLIDEIDKADVEFPNDLLQELDKMEFYVYETGELVQSKNRPIVIITSNNEKELPDAFLRRCFFHHIAFPDRDVLEKIISVHIPKIKKKLLKDAMDIFFDIRKVPGLKKKPSTSELIDWLKLIVSDDIAQEVIASKNSNLVPPLYGALLKNEQQFALPDMPGISSDVLNSVRYTWIFPNLTFAIGNDALWIYEVHPLNSDSCKVFQTTCFPESTVKLSSFKKLSKKYYHRMDAAIEEDIPALENQQAGLRNPYAEPGRFSPLLEANVVSFANWYSKKLIESDNLSLLT